MGKLLNSAKPPAKELKRAGDAEHDPANIGGKPGVMLLDIPLTDLASNPRNPRDENLKDDPETAELAESMDEVGQLQPAVVVARETYLKQWPEYAEKIEAPWVLMIGNRREAAAELKGWKALECVVRDRITKDLEKLGSIPMHENIHRKGINALRIAYWLADEMELHGNNQSEVARRIRKSQPWVNQHLQLLKLIPELQDLLQADEISATTGRTLAKLDKDEQWKLWEYAGTLDEEDRHGFWAGRGAGYKGFIAADPEPDQSAVADEPVEAPTDAAESEPQSDAPTPQAGRAKGFVIRIPDKSPATLATAVREMDYTHDDLAELLQLIKELMAEVN